MKRQIILMILDGWGIGAKDNSNPIYLARTPYIDYIKKNFLIGSLQASGIAVGLPWGEVGNSEVGHLTIGAGKVLYQHYPRINMSINDGSFFTISNLKKAFEHAKSQNSAVHLVGLLSKGNVHSSTKHLKMLIKMAKQEECPALYLQLFLDGRDSPLRSAPELLEEINTAIKDNNIGIIASLAGRAYGMDRDKHWDRIEKAYNILIGKTINTKTSEELLKNTYSQDLSDEYAEPTIINQPHPIKENDSVIFFNFREDRMREIIEAFINPNFSIFETKKFKNVYMLSMTEYADKFTKDFKLPVIFPPQENKNPLGKILSDNGKTQLRISETEKYAHVTYFFNGLVEQPFLGEMRILVPSRNILSHAEHPEMMASEITNRIIQSMEDNAFDFILANYPNGDIVAHTGNFNASMIAVKIIDQEIGKLTKKVLDQNDVLIITADHGNVENMFDVTTSQITSGHNNSSVPIYIIAREFYRPKTDVEIIESEKQTSGILADIAPTILEIMNLPKPPEMTGASLLNILS